MKKYITILYFLHEASAPYQNKSHHRPLLLYTYLKSLKYFLLYHWETAKQGWATQQQVFPNREAFLKPQTVPDIEVKENAIDLLEYALIHKRKKCMIGTGSMTDPYIPLEMKIVMSRFLFYQFYFFIKAFLNWVLFLFYVYMI